MCESGQLSISRFRAPHHSTHVAAGRRGPRRGLLSPPILGDTNRPLQVTPCSNCAHRARRFTWPNPALNTFQAHSSGWCGTSHIIDRRTRVLRAPSTSAQSTSISTTLPSPERTSGQLRPTWRVRRAWSPTPIRMLQQGRMCRWSHGQLFRRGGASQASPLRRFVARPRCKRSISQACGHVNRACTLLCLPVPLCVVTTTLYLPLSAWDCRSAAAQRVLQLWLRLRLRRS